MELRATFLKSFFVMALVPVAMALAGCPDPDPNEPEGNTSGAKGTLYVNQSNSNSSMNIHSYNLTSGVSTNLISGQQPNISPEKTIVCSVPVEGLVEFNAAGTESRTIVKINQNAPLDVKYDNHVNNPQVSRNGQMIAYEGAFNDVYVVSRQTGELLYTFEGCNKPSWTPDGRIVVAGSSAKGLFITTTDFSDFEPIGTGLIAPSQPEVSPDGTKVAFISNNHLHTINIDGTGKQQITTSEGNESMPVWSPDGKWIAVYVTSIPQSSIYLVPLEKSGTVNIKNISSNFKPHLSLQYDWVE